MLRGGGRGLRGGWIFLAVAWAKKEGREGRKDSYQPVEFVGSEGGGGGVGEAFQGGGRVREEEPGARGADLGRRDEDYRGWRESVDVVCALDVVLRGEGRAG